VEVLLETVQVGVAEELEYVIVLNELLYVANMVWFSPWMELVALMLVGLVFMKPPPFELSEPTRRTAARARTTTTDTDAAYTAVFFNPSTPSRG